MGYEKAIVSEIAGTTRDAVEGTLEIGGVRFNLYDTAGMRESSDRIESIGIERAENIVRAADVVVFVSDGTEKATYFYAEYPRNYQKIENAFESYLGFSLKVNYSDF